ncbi:hypothetical protein ACP6C7_14400 [Mycolicibacterium septicum]|uniref:Uncharacterized protein n=1 Tax=Mycolicibacterium septicum TaxID=98668 RepID=A0ABW9M1R9_9MYCO
MTPKFAIRANGRRAVEAPTPAPVSGGAVVALLRVLAGKLGRWADGPQRARG